MHDILTGEVDECVTNANWYFVTTYEEPVPRMKR